MGHYKSNIRDLEFNLVEVLHLEKVLASGEFGDLDVDTVREMLSEAARLAEGPVAESFAESDRHPPTFDPATHSVTLPEPFTESVRAWVRGEWFRIGLDEAVGGVPAPAMVSWALNELPLGAQPAVFIYLAGPVLADILYHVGNEEQKRWATTAVERLWGATMVLTEPDAGSDVGAGRTKAVEQPDGTWHIDGVKRFITSGDAGDIFENILHLVLARPEGAGPGTKGLSLFLVPKFLFDPETGEPGERNGVFVTNVEHKMGLKVSATCELTFGDKHPATGTLFAACRRLCARPSLHCCACTPRPWPPSSSEPRRQSRRRRGVARLAGGDGGCQRHRLRLGRPPPLPLRRPARGGRGGGGDGH